MEPWYKQRSAYLMMVVMCLFVITIRMFWNTELPSISKEHITGIITFCGVLVAVFVLRFQIKSQSNSFKLENYKSQYAAMSKLCSSSIKLRHGMQIFGGTDKEKRIKEVGDERDKMIGHIQDGILVLPDRVVQLAYNICATAGSWRVIISDKDADYTNGNLATLVIQAYQLNEKLIEYCRSTLNASGLTNDTLKLIGNVRETQEAK